jgi:MYXO-CTERM domain-containing protein
MRQVHWTVAALAAAGAISSAAHAAIVIDPAGDLLPTFAGPPGGDLDVLTTEAIFDNTTNTIVFTSTVAAPVGTTAGGVYVFGVDRGAGTERFVAGTPSVGAGVRFDMVVLLRSDGTGTVNDLISGTSTPLPIGSILIAGNTITSTPLAISLFPSQGFAAANYTFNLWPRSPGNGNTFIADFAPDASNAAVTVVPGTGPAGLALVGGLALLRRRR